MTRPSRSARAWSRAGAAASPSRRCAARCPAASSCSRSSGTIKADGQSLLFEDIKGRIGGGEASATIDARPGPNGIALNARVQMSNVDGNALRYRALAMPTGRTSMQMTLTSQGRSAAALIGALSGSGTVTLESARNSPASIRARSKSRCAPATTGRRGTMRG